MEGLRKLEYESSLGVHRGTYQEYNEMAIQFGYLTMFASVAPWAACFCMANNEIERRVADQVAEVARPLASVGPLPAGYEQLGLAVAARAATAPADGHLPLHAARDPQVDAYKMLYTQQRPRYHGAENIGMWYEVFNWLTVAAVVVNCLIAGYTSTVLSQVYELTGEQVLWVVVGLEHALLMLKLMVQLHIPDVPL